MARSSSASCSLPTSAFLHGAVSPLLWNLLHDAWHVPPLPPAPSQPVQSCMALSPLLWKMLHIWHVPPPPPAPSHSVQSRIALFLLSCVSCFMYNKFLFTESCSNDFYCSFYCSRSCFVVLFLECTLCGVSHDNSFPLSLLSIALLINALRLWRQHCHGLLLPFSPPLHR